MSDLTREQIGCVKPMGAGTDPSIVDPAILKQLCSMALRYLDYKDKPMIINTHLSPEAKDNLIERKVGDMFRLLNQESAPRLIPASDLEGVREAMAALIDSVKWSNEGFSQNVEVRIAIEEAAVEQVAHLGRLMKGGAPPMKRDSWKEIEAGFSMIKAERDAWKSYALALDAKAKWTLGSGGADPTELVEFAEAFLKEWRWL